MKSNLKTKFNATSLDGEEWMMKAKQKNNTEIIKLLDLSSL